VKLLSFFGYWCKKYYSASIKWILVDGNKKPVYCHRCSNFANGVIVRFRWFNVPYCGKHFSEIYFEKYPEKNSLNLPMKMKI